MVEFESNFLQELTIYASIVTLCFILLKVILRQIHRNGGLSHFKLYALMNFKLYVFMFLIISIVLHIYVENRKWDRNDYFYEIKECGIDPVTAKAKKINKYPFGIELTLQGDSVVHHRMELYENHDEFIDRVNRGALVSKVKNSTDIMLINGADTTYYPLVY